MKILYAGMKYDYGIPERGHSFEHYNFYETLIGMGHNVEYFDFMPLFQQYGAHKMTKMLRERVDQLKPDLLFTFLFTNQFDADVLSKITKETSTITFNWFADDHWRFDSFTKYWTHCFSFVSTTDLYSLPKYHSINYANVLLTQWGINHFLYKKKNLPLLYDASFIGQAYGNRPAVIKRLRKQGIQIQTAGTHWHINKWHDYLLRLHLLSKKKYDVIANETRISQEQMLNIFQQSKINLNLSASSQFNYRNQIKGRNFEIPGCGGFQLSEYAEHLEKYYQPDKEIVIFKSLDELIEKINYFLSHESERLAIAIAGYNRTIREHTYEQRFNTLFHQMGLQ